MKKTYVIDIRGCDDTTAFTMDLDENELELVKRLCEKSKETSEYRCMPDMSVVALDSEEGQFRYRIFIEKETNNG